MNKELDRERVYESLKILKEFPEWKMFVKYMDEVIEAHKEASLSYSTKDKTEDAKRQAWLIEGIRETLEEPESVVSEHDNFIRKIGRMCALCGQVIKNFAAGNKEIK